MKKYTYPLLIVLTVFLFNSCKGPAGDPGPAGSQGAQGPKGDKGDVGSANIISSGWISLPKKDILSRYKAEDLTSGSRFFGGEIDKLSQKILDDGIILAYNRLVSNKQRVAAIPFTLDFGHSEPGFQVSYYFEASPKEINCYIQFSKAIPDFADYIEDEEYRFIFIPGPSGARLKNIDLKNYEAVKKAFNLQD